PAPEPRVAEPLGDRDQGLRAQAGRRRDPQRASGHLPGHAGGHGDDPDEPAALRQGARRALLGAHGRLRDRARDRIGTGRDEMKPALMFAAALIAVTVRAPAARAQGLPNVIEGFFPTQLAAGQTNVLHLGVPGRGDVTGVEINPSAGITVKDIKRGDVREGSLFWEVTVDVAGDAAPGNRTIVAVNQNGRTAPRPIAVYAHVPKISDVKI